MTTSRWQNQRTDADAHNYVRRFRTLASRGTDTDGEARFVDVVLARESAVLDAGCGTGRVGAALISRGHRVTAVDSDPILIEEARTVAGLDVHLADLATLDLPDRFDAIVAAGNVMVYLTPGSEKTVLERFRLHLRDGGALITGFATDREYTADQYLDDLASVGFVVQQRFATWDLEPWVDDAGWVVVIARSR